MIIVRAEEADLHRLLRFRTDSAAWLAPLGTDQWSQPFPAEHMLASIRAGEVFLIKEAVDTDAAATITLDQDADDRLWTPQEQADSARYVHKLTVDRKYAGTGLGARILDWAGDRAARSGAMWLRLDAWTTNTRLHAYYRSQNFEHVRTSPDPSVVSGWAAQRPALRNDAHGFVEAFDTLPWADTPESGS